MSFFLHAIAVCSVSLMFSGLSMAIEDEIRLRRNNPETSFGDVTREQILETRNRRKRQLKVMLVDARKKLADHSAGEKPLTEEAKAILVNSIDVYRRKIESMEGELEEWEIERLIARETEAANRRKKRSRDSRKSRREL